MEKQYFERIPFGKEQRLNLGFGATFPVCNVRRGKFHEYGCQGEECPQCGNPLVNCCCECLSPSEEFGHVKAIEASFSSLDEASTACSWADNREADGMSPNEKAAFLYFTNHAPPEFRAEIRRGFDKIFPGLKPCGVNEQGERVYSSVDIAKALEIDHDEIIESIRNLETEDYQNRGWS